MKKSLPILRHRIQFGFMILTFHFPDRWDWCSSFTRQYHGLITAENLLSHLHWWTRAQWYGIKNGRCYAKYEVAIGWILINNQKPKRVFSRQCHLCPINKLTWATMNFWHLQFLLFLLFFLTILTWNWNRIFCCKPFCNIIGDVIKLYPEKICFGHGIGRIEN